MSNHQSEADPAIIALLLEMRLPHIAENLVKFACVLSDYLNVQSINEADFETL